MAAALPPPLLVCIPARHGSTRLPGKPLITIAGRTLLARVIDAARRDLNARHAAEIVVATDHPAIRDEAERCGCRAVMTDAALANGSARSLAAVRAVTPQPHTLISLQGDTPFFPAGTLTALADALVAGARVATPVMQLSWPDLDAFRLHKRAAPFSGTTCVIDDRHRALWFSKQILPAIRDEAARRTADVLSPVRRHVGIYGYQFEALARFDVAPMSVYEELEGLEQLRFIALGIPVTTVPVAGSDLDMNGVDTLVDVIAAEERLARFGDPFGLPPT